MRISERMRYDTVSNRIHDAKEQSSNAMERLSSQKDVQKLSDNPVAATGIIRFREKIDAAKQYQTNIEYSRGFLDRSEEAMQALNDNLIRAKELAVAMANDSYDSMSRNASGREVREIIDEVVHIGNTTFNGRYIFAGFRNQTPPLTVDGDYLGDDGSIFLQMSPGNFRQINVPGRAVFEASLDEREKGHFNLVHTLEVLYDGLQSNNKDMIRNALSELDFQLEKATSNQATIGAISNSLKETAARLGSEDVTMRANLSKLQDADMYDATSEFKRTETVLQSTLLSSTKLLQPSLLNFLQ